MSLFRTDAVLGKAIKTGTGTRVPLYTGAPELKVEIAHGLGQVPTDIFLGDRDKWCDFYTVSKDRDRAILVFSEARVNLNVNFVRD